MYGSGHEGKINNGSDDYTAAYLLSNKSAIALLGYDPSKHKIDNKLGTFVEGFYNSDADTIQTKGTKADFNPTLLTHEFIHRGLKKLHDAHPDDPVLKRIRGHARIDEAITRTLHHKLAGTKPAQSEVAHYELNQTFKRDLDDIDVGKDVATIPDILDYIEALAQKHIARTKPGGPR